MNREEKQMRIGLPVLLLAAGGFAWGVEAAGSPVLEQIHPGAWMVYNDSGNWGGASMGTSHQTGPEYHTRKTLDLSVVPEELWRKIKVARVRVFFAIQDYSWATPGLPANGLDESFEVVVNGRARRYGTADGFEGRSSGQEPLRWRWTDFAVPLDAITRGPNEIVFRKLPAEGKPKTDDYIYIGIDNTVEHGTSAVSFDGGASWTSEKLNAIDAHGEYMVRLVLVTTSLATQVVWGPPRTTTVTQPAWRSALHDPEGLVGFCEADGPGRTAKGPWVPAGSSARLWIEREAVDPLEPVVATVEYEGTPPILSWLDDNSKPVAAESTLGEGTVSSRVTAPRRVPRLLRVAAPKDAPITLRNVALTLSMAYMRPPVIDMCPRVVVPSCRPVAKPAICRKDGNVLILGDAHLTARFACDDGLRLQSITTGYTDRPLLPSIPNETATAQASHLFLIEVDGKRLGSGDFTVNRLTTHSKPMGFEAELLLLELRMAATLTAETAGQGRLRLGLRLSNRGETPVQVKTAFPHIAGLEADYYLFPYCGGIIADVPTYLRTAYGENTAWWQMIDVFRPAEGCGLSVRIEDEAGGYKCPVLRKGDRYDDEYGRDEAGRLMDPGALWKRSLAPAPGVSLGFEYLRRTVAAGAALQLPPAVLGVHEGDWHNALAEYAKWAHHVWKWRPYPGALADWWNVTAPGWGQSPLVDEKGQWRTDYLTEQCGVAEMMSWWEWSDLGPWRVEMNLETLPKTLGEALFARYKPYWVMDPVAKRLRYPLNRGDYAYNETWGGLEAFRKHVEVCKDRGTLPGVYIDGMLACDTTDVGHNFGPIYGAVNPYWEDSLKCPLNPKGYVAAYASWNMCCDTEWWADYLSRCVARIFRDTGIRYLRIDEFGHAGYPCFSDKHKHLFSPEPGLNAWLQGCAEICKRAHALMDRIRPDLALTTEFPGNDHLAANLDGSIVYEVGYHALPVRPVVCNLLRFYFPECKPFDLDYKNTPHGQEVKLWNGMGAFGSRYSLRYQRLLRENADAFGYGRVEALVPTLQGRVYLNRFSAADKQITVVLNARPYPVGGPLVELALRKGRHCVDLLRGVELKPERQGQRWVVGERLESSDIAVLADLPLLAQARVEGTRIHVTLPCLMPNLQVVLSDLDNQCLDEAPGAATVTLTAPEEAAKGPLVVKLFRGKYLADLIPVPQQ